MLSNISVDLELAAKVAWLFCLISPLLLVNRKSNAGIASFAGGFLCVGLFVCSFFPSVFVVRDNFIYTNASFNMLVLANLIVIPMFKGLPKVEFRTFLSTIVAINIGFVLAFTASTLTTKAHTQENIANTYRSQIVGYVNNNDSIFDVDCYVEGLPDEAKCIDIKLEDNTYQSGKETVIANGDQQFSIKHALNYSERGNTHIKFDVTDTNTGKHTVFIYKDTPNEIEKNNLGITSLITLVVSLLWGLLAWNVVFIHKRAAKKKQLIQKEVKPEQLS